MNLNELRDFKLTNDEWHTLTAMQAGLRPRPSHKSSAHVDMLILAGLVEGADTESLALTPDGEAAAAAIDMIFDWDDFALVEEPESPSDGEEMAFLDGEPITRRDALAIALARPERMTVGSLVRHTTTGGIGLITHHTMWDSEWGAFSVEFCGPVDNVVDGRVVNQLRRITDRADNFERV